METAWRQRNCGLGMGVHLAGCLSSKLYPKLKHFAYFHVSVCTLYYFNTTDFLSDPKQSDVQAGISDTDWILILFPTF